MKIKTFDFIPFEEWKKLEKGYKQKIGDYTCAIEIFSWGINNNSTNVYKAAISTYDNPLNVYVKKNFEEVFSCNKRDEEKLKEWYEGVVERIREYWERFILQTYFDD